MEAAAAVAVLAEAAMVAVVAAMAVGLAASAGLAVWVVGLILACESQALADALMIGSIGKRIHC